MKRSELEEMRSTAVMEALRLRRPVNRAELGDWVTLFTGLHLPRHAACAGHQTPLDYLCHAFLEADLGGGGGDAIVWACRGGGKTMLGAVATLLDLLFKPGVQIRILAGSLDQSEKMYGHLRRLFAAAFADQLQGPPTRRRLELRNGSAVEVLAQSDRAVRGQRVQRVRCDEVELFKPEVWQAAQLTTRALMRRNGEIEAQGAIEAFSTMHKPGGLMQQLLAETAARRRVFAWCIWDVIATCHPERVCATCPLWNDCGGRAKQANGFIPVEDVIAMHGRIAQSTWRHEMLCHPPKLENAVFPAFDTAAHVRAFPPARLVQREETVIVENRGLRFETLVCGVDFGFRRAFVCLWVMMFRDLPGRRVAWVVDEYVAQQQTLARNIEVMRGRAPVSPVAGQTVEPWRPAVVYCDVAGRGINGQTARTDEAVLREAGFKVRSSAMEIEPGLAMLTDLIEPAAAETAGVRLLIDPRCGRLIAALEGYHRLANGMAHKDGVHDHLIDALRYAIVNHDAKKGKVEIRSY